MNSEFIYFARELEEENGLIKIGRSNNPSKRLPQLNTGNGRILEVIAQIPGGAKEESELHHMFKDIRRNGEWFSPSQRLLEFIEIVKEIDYLPDINESNGNQQSLDLQIPKKEADIIYIETDYNLFEFYGDNRALDSSFLNKLKKSFEEKDLFSSQPILVFEKNGKYYIKDGQHRYTVARDLGIPIYFTLTTNIDRQDLLRIQSRKNWTLRDYLNSYCRQAKFNYIKFNQFYKKNNWLDVPLIVRILSQKVGGVKALERFKLGEFSNVTEADLERGQTIIDYLKDYHAVLEIHPSSKAKLAVKTIAFIYAIQKLYNNPDYDHERVIRQLKHYPAKFTIYSQTVDYIYMIEDIINYRRKTENKVRLRD